MKRTVGCPVELALEVLGGKWRAVILAHIKEGAQRYADLRRRVPSMSDKMLTQRLRELAADGLVARDGAAYVLTPRGDGARAALQALHDWGTRLVVELDVNIAREEQR